MDFDFSNYNVAATDTAGLIALVGFPGLIFMFGAVTGTEYHTFGRLSWPARLIALAAADAVMWGPTVALMTIKNVTFKDVWEAAFVWKNAPVGVFGWAVFFVVMTVMFSPILNLCTLLSVVIQRRREMTYQLVR